jgi:hypothetical protein
VGAAGCDGVLWVWTGRHCGERPRSAGRTVGSSSAVLGTKKVGDGVVSGDIAHKQWCSNWRMDAER